MVKTQAPGYYRAMLGDFEVTVLSDGTLPLNPVQLLRAEKQKVVDALKRDYLPEAVETSVNAYLVNTGTKLVLIDAGTGGLFGPSLGKLLTNLRASGYRPEQVDEIYITHLHPDHVGGVTVGGARAFPNATLRMDKRDADFWLNEANMTAAPQEAKGFFQGAMASAKPYQEAGKLKPFEGSQELVPGVRAQSTYGHTPDARRSGAVRRSVRHHPVRHGQHAGGAAARCGLRGCREERLSRGRGAPCLPRPGPAPGGRGQELPLRAAQLLVAAVNGVQAASAASASLAAGCVCALMSRSAAASALAFASSPMATPSARTKRMSVMPKKPNTVFR
jgi:glyoxylase-like metal-dependent hydrolase (beta-lactamase superfamily II)